jgi:exodeoxyribonuclease VII small subunit
MKPEPLRFEDTLRRLEDIVAELEGDQLELARALTLFQEGIECMRSAAGELARVEAEVQRLVERADGSFELTDLGG